MTARLNIPIGVGLHRRRSWVYIVIGLVGMVLGVFVLYSSWNGPHIPKRSHLDRASGRVAWVKGGGGRSGDIIFAFEGNPGRYVYNGISHEVGLVQHSLSRPDRPVVEVLFERTDENKYPARSVYEVWVAGECIRTYEQVRAAWTSNSKVGIWFAPILIIMGGYSILRGAMKRPEKEWTSKRYCSRESQ